MNIWNFSSLSIKSFQQGVLLIRITHHILVGKSGYFGLQQNNLIKPSCSVEDQSIQFYQLYQVGPFVGVLVEVLDVLHRVWLLHVDVSLKLHAEERAVGDDVGVSDVE